MIASAATLALVMTVLTVPPAADAASRSGFPDAPKDPEVAGVIEGGRKAPEKPHAEKSPVVKEPKSVRFTVPLTGKGEKTPEADAAGITVRLLEDPQGPAAEEAGPSLPLDPDASSPGSDVPATEPEASPAPEPDPTADAPDPGARPSPGPTESSAPAPAETTAPPKSRAPGVGPSPSPSSEPAPAPEPAPSSDPAPTPVPGASPAAPESVQVEVWDSKKRSKFAGARFALSVAPPAHPGRQVQVALSDAAIAASFGGDYASRLRWVAAPADGAGIADAEDVAPVRTAEGLTFTLPAAQPMVLAAMSTASSADGSGTYAASPLKPSSSWDVSAQTGAFSWSYPIAAPPAPAGATPQVALAYNSQLVDGATSSTNNQPSAIGEGWTLTGGGFIERRYASCSSEPAPGTSVAGSGDLCWATDNATISFGSRSGTLVRDEDSGEWRLEGDDNSRIEKLIGTGEGCRSNGTYNTECWRLTTTDGTRYYFGLNRLPGWSAGKRMTDSVFTVPVFGNDADDPCHAATFADSSCMQGWRWNLDYVVDVHGNAQALYYTAETNNYRANDTTVSSYVRGGQLELIDYGLTSSNVYASNAATSRILFGYDTNGRCNPENLDECSTIALDGDAETPDVTSVYPDVPFDLNCTSGPCTSMTSPSFWSTARLAKITTQSFTGGSYKTADVFTLTQSFPDPGDGESPALWLDSVTRKATAGTTAITEQPTTFQRVPMQNRVWVVDGLAPLDKFRVSAVLLPTGGRVSVNYSAKECTPAMAPAILAAPWSNDKRCFPLWWTPDVDYPTQARQDLFHKYVVTSMVEDPFTGGAGAPAITTEYEYTGAPAWRYVDDRLVAEDRRGWSDYAGYDEVEVRRGGPANPAGQSTTQYVFYQGLNGDREDDSGGEKSVDVTGTTVPDERWFAGRVRSQKTLNGVGGAVVSETVTTPWASAVTADDGVHQARVLGVARTDVTTPVSTGGTRTASTINTMDARGFVTKTEQSAGAGERATCTVSAYAADNDSAWVIGLPSVVTDYAVPCSQTGAATTAQVLSHKKIAYDGAAVGAAATRGLVSASWEASGFTGAALSTAQWVTTGQFTYDAAGRILTSKDAANRTVTTAYSPAAGAAAGSGPLASTTVTNPAGWVSSTTVEAYRGLPVTVVDDNGKTATTEYDALGRLVKAWRTDHTKAEFPSLPSVAYEYTVSTTSPSKIKQTQLTWDNVVSTYRFVDGLGRDVQAQTPAVGGSGAVITDTAYDDQGRPVASNDQYLAPTVTPGSGLFVPSTVSQIATRTEKVYDGAGRVTAEVLRSFGSELRRTSVAYRGSDRVDSVPPAGGVSTSTWMDAWGRKTRVAEWRGVIDGPGVGSTSLRYEYDARDRMTKMTDDAGNVWTWTFDLRGRQTGASDPDAGATSATFDDLGNQVTRTDARGVTLAYTYDVMNRKSTERSGTVTGAVLASWTYDTLAKGLLTSSSRFDGAAEYKTQIAGYDDGYRPTGSTVSIPASAPAFGGTTYTTEEYYNQDGTVGATVLPAIAGLPYEEIYPGYDQLGRPSNIGGGDFTASVSYSAASQVTQIVRTGTAWSALTFGYSAGTRDLASLDETTRRNGTQFTREALREYTRNAAGIITKAVTTSPSGTTVDTQCFTYGPLQELTGAWTPANGDCAGGAGSALGGPAPYSESFTVDPVTGNRTGMSYKPGASASVQSSTLSYPAAGQPRPHGVTQVQTVTGSSGVTTGYGYDASGGMTNYGGTSVAFDESGRVKQIGTGTTAEKSVYTADGQLLLRYGGSDGASLFLGDTILRNKAGVTTGVRSYVVAGIGFAERVSGTGGGLWWSSPDPVGTVGLQIKASTGQVTRRWMDPFGQARGVGGSWSSLLGYLNQPASSTGITQLGARAYDPGLGKFLSVDPVLDTGEPRHANAYAYSMNSPVSYSDANGLQPLGATDGPSKYNPGPPVYTGVAPPPQSTGGSPPPSAGNGGGDGGGTPAPAQEVQWWNPFTWDHDAWVTAGEIALGTVAAVGVGACVVATAGICGVVGVGVGMAIGAGVGAGIGAASYALKDGPKTAEGWVTSIVFGGASGAVGVGVLALKPVVTAAAAAIEKAAVTAGTKAAPAAESAVKASSCVANSFVSGTKVELADGESKPIEDIALGDKVLAADPQTGSTGPEDVSRLIQGGGEKDLVTLTVTQDDGSQAQVVATAGHPFWGPDVAEWIPAGELQPGMWLQTSSGTWVMLTAVQHKHRVQTVYNLTVSTTHTFSVYAGHTTLLTHNCGEAAAAASSTTSAVPRDALGRFTSGAGGESAETAAGRSAHASYENTIGGGEYSFNKAMPGSLDRPDAVDWEQSIVRELKPDSPKAIAAGTRQVNAYREYLEQLTGRDWTAYVDVYSR